MERPNIEHGATGATGAAPAGDRPRADPASPAQREFEAAARAAGMDPADRWVGGYADYEWDHLRPMLAAYGIELNGIDLLEFGCNVGASAVVAAALGARVTGVDVDAAVAAVAAANLDRHGLGSRARILHVPDTRAIPLASASFDLLIANSVLEYVAPDDLRSVIGELHRLLRPGGRLLICGTASRLSPREIHSRRWLVNYLPRWLDGLTGRSLQRGLGPLRLARALDGRFEDVTGDGWQKARAAVHGRVSPAMRGIALAAAAIGRSPGWLSPHIEMLLRKA